MSPSHYLVTSSRIRMIYAFCIFNSRKLLYKNVSFLWKAGNVGGGEAGLVMVSHTGEASKGSFFDSYNLILNLY